MAMLFLLGLAQGLAAPGMAAAAAQPVVATAVAPARSTGFVVLGPAETPNGREIQRSRDGLFYLTAIVNGTAVRFIVDTGATVVVLTPEDARRAGLAIDAGDFRNEASTANGRASMARVVLNEVVVGSRKDQRVEAAVVPQGLGVSLLGQSWLSRLRSVTITGDRMLLD